MPPKPRAGVAAFLAERRAAMDPEATRAQIESAVFVAQSRCDFVAERPVGTVGMAPCVGLAVQLGPRSWFVAHIDCPNEVFESQEDVQAGIAGWTAHRLEELRIPPGAERIYVVTPTDNFATRSIANGIETYFSPIHISTKRGGGFLIDGDRYFTVSDPTAATPPDPRGGQSFSVPEEMTRPRAAPADAAKDAHWRAHASGDGGGHMGDAGGGGGGGAGGGGARSGAGGGGVEGDGDE